MVNRIVPSQKADTGNHKQDTENRPKEGTGSRFVANQRLIRPVVGVGHGFIRALGRCRPCSPKEETGHLATVLVGIDGVIFHRVGFAQFSRGWIAAKHAFIMRRYRGNCFCAIRRYRDRLVSHIKGIDAKFRLKLSLQLGLFTRFKLVVSAPKLLRGTQIEQGHSLTV